MALSVIFCQSPGASSAAAAPAHTPTVHGSTTVDVPGDRTHTRRSQRSSIERRIESMLLPAQALLRSGEIADVEQGYQNERSAAYHSFEVHRFRLDDGRLCASPCRVREQPV